MSVEINRGPVESNEPERREAQGERVPFEGIVEVGGALGPSFEAQAVDVSEDGIHLRTAYLPELGQPLTCRIEVAGDIVLAAGEVVWRQEAARGGEFGLKFTDLDATSEEALKKLVTIPPSFNAKGPGMRVRLHIDGLGAPMRARIKGSAAEGIVVGSELGFLQVGKELELEDAKTGGKRGARIDRVEVEINPHTQIPQLVVSLRYDVADTDAPASAAPMHAPAPAAGGPDDTPEPSVIDDEKVKPTLRGMGAASVEASTRLRARALKETGRADTHDDQDPFGPMRSGVGEAFHRASAKVGPALSRLAARAVTTFALVRDRTRKAAGKSHDVAVVARRTTAPAPTGGLHATGRKVVRTEPISAQETLEEKPVANVAKRRVAVASAVLLAGALAIAAFHKPSPTAQTTAPTDPASSVTVLGASAPPSTSAVAGSGAPLSSAVPVVPAPALPPLANVPPEDSSNNAAPPSADDSHVHARAHGATTRVTPFGNGAVGHANVLHLKMDGVIEKIEGATTPTGFTVVIPDRRSLEAAAPLAARDSRIAAIRITNEANGAELAVNFKDGVPNYQVRAKGDSLEILLAPQGKLGDADDGPKASKKKTTHSHH